jgi:acetylornithine/N-succinyldiaminopimelate aminotransferase
MSTRTSNRTSNSASHAFDHAPMANCPFMPVFGPPAIMFERGRGTELWDSDGKRYLDFLSGIAVVSLGHSNPVVAEAVGDQLERLLHVSNFFANPVATEAAVKINELLLEATGHRGQIFFTNSGAESNECAIKLARKHGGRGRHTVVSALGSFHGRTLATLAATGQPAKHEPFAPMPEGFRHVAWGDLDAMRQAVDGTVAAVLIEPILGEGGIHPATTEYLQGIRALCDETGALMMVDEIQTGFARTGRWFGFEHAGVSPDVVTLAKAMGNGMPVGACWARADVAAVFQPGDHGSTYSGTAIATAAVNAVIDEMQRIDAPAVARRQGRRIADGLRSVPGVADVRGRGLMLGVELVEGIDAKAIYTDLLGLGLIVNAVTPSTLRLVPPITVTDDEIDEAIAMITASLESALDLDEQDTGEGATGEGDTA